MELTNFEEIGDEGEIWSVNPSHILVLILLNESHRAITSIVFLLLCIRFGEDSVEKMVDWALENVPSNAEPTPHVLEIGSGNGALLFALHEAGYLAEKLCGIDYSEDAVRLACAIGKSRTAEAEVSESSAEEAQDTDPERQHGRPDRITFQVCDFLREEVPLLEDMLQPPDENVHAAAWDLVLDKGTYDAIALAEKDENGKNGVDYYPARLGRIVKPGGFFLICCASKLPWLVCRCDGFLLNSIVLVGDHPACNFTEDELRAKFSYEETGLQYQYVAVNTRGHSISD